MNIAYTMAPGRGDTDLVLAAVAERLAAKGYRLCGTVQINTECPDQGPCDMDVRVLPDGPEIRISQSLGKEAKGCRLDPQSLEIAVGLAGARLREGSDVLIVNKFGKHEADGRGFRPLVAEAIELGIPVLVGLNTINEPAFQNFSGGLAQALAPDVKTLTDWIEACATPTGSASNGTRSAETNAA
jgi:nucleoside-triphosphatase THEP1